MRILLQIWCIFVLSAVCAAAEINRTEFSIRVIDSNGRAIEDAEVGLFEKDYRGGEIAAMKSAAQRTDTHGQVKLGGRFRNRYVIFAAARKQGYFLGWRWAPYEAGESQITIILGKPCAIGGIVVSESGKPIEGATVRAFVTSYQCSGEQLQHPINFENDWLTTRTDKNGKFNFSNIPPDGAADFVVEAPGYATTYTFWEQDQHPGFQFKAGKDNVKIVVSPAAMIKGRVVDANGGGIKGAALSISSRKHYGSYIPKAQAVSQKDGYFEFANLMPGKYVISNPDQGSAASEWLVKGIEAEAAIKPNTAYLSVQAYKGELLGIRVIDSETKKSITGEEIYLYQKEANEPYVQQYHATEYTDANGLVRVRKPKAVCQCYAGSFDDYKGEELQIGDGNDRKLMTIELTPYPNARGKVIDESGKAVKGIQVRVKPSGKIAMLTDKEGRFDIAYDSRSDTSYVYAFDRDKGLAGLAKVVDGNEIIVKVKPSPRRNVKVVDENGRGIVAARVQLYFNFSNWLSGTGIEAITDSNGNCDLGYVAEPTNDVSYRIGAYTAGYSPLSYQRIGDWSEEIVLKKADLTVSGRVVDANGRGITGLELFCNSNNQGRLQMVTDVNGWFTMDNLSKGEVTFQAGLGGSKGIDKPGRMVCQAGDVNVIIVIGQETAHVATKSLIGKPLPDVNSLGIKLDLNDIKDKAIVLCFVDMSQRPSRHCFNELGQKYNDLTQKGVVVAVVAFGNVPVGIDCPFHLVRIAADEKVHFAWGIKSLPWLILTDSKQTILAEGFSVPELDEKLKTIMAN